ncbi:energy transducer TonB [Pseudomonas akapageensis]|uniref:energy transducer TonB n=1 Tax=Pseudomonas akapageensis TaxID=2609961 RepID=UPI00140E7591|nr:energy transducer TonB [Pseudomonas akapageensis]
MSDIQYASIGHLPLVGDYSLRNTQALGGVSHLWQDFFAQAMADQMGDAKQVSAATVNKVDPKTGEPLGGSEVLAEIISQRLCDVQDTALRPPEPLFLPIAEFEMDLLDKPAPPFEPAEIIAQQRQLDFESGWVRPLVLNAGQPVPEPGPAPAPRPMHLPIAEFEMDLLDKKPEPFDAVTLREQQEHLDFDISWTRPVVLQNVRLAA